MCKMGFIDNLEQPGMGLFLKFFAYGPPENPPFLSGNNERVFGQAYNTKVPQNRNWGILCLTYHPGQLPDL